MSLYKRGKWYWTDFTIETQRFRKPLDTTDENEAKRRERKLQREAEEGTLKPDEKGPKRLFDAVDRYLSDRRSHLRPRTIKLYEERLKMVKSSWGDIRLSAITPQAVLKYQQTRQRAGTANRTINMDVGCLALVLKHFGVWKRLEKSVEFLQEGEREIGRALTQEEQDRLFTTAKANPDWEHVYCAAVVSANTTMRPVEVRHLRRKDVDLFKKVVYVRRSKLESSHRKIPLNAGALKAIATMVSRLDALGYKEPEHYIWPKCQWGRFDATQPMRKWDTAWRALRAAANLPGLRFYDLRHTLITELCEAGTPDEVVMAIAGHMSKRMMEHYSHIRMEAKRKALEQVDRAREAGRQQAQEQSQRETVQ